MEGRWEVVAKVKGISLWTDENCYEFTVGVRRIGCTVVRSKGFEEQEEVRGNYTPTKRRGLGNSTARKLLRPSVNKREYM